MCRFCCLIVVVISLAAAPALRAQDEPLVPAPAPAKPSVLSATPTTMPTTQPALASQPAVPPLPAGWLRVTGDEVNLRARPDLNAVVVMRMPRDTVLKADGGEFGWYRVQAPPGVFSYVATLYVQRRGDGTGAVSVQSGTLRVRTGSLLRELNPDQSDVQTRLENGTSVRIIAEEGEWLKIVPPDGVWFYVSEDFVSRISEEVAGRLRTAALEAADGATAPEAVGAIPMAPVSDRELDTPLGRQLLAAEALVEAEGRKPVLDQKWQASLDALTPLAAQQAEPRVAWLAAEWIANVQAQIQKQDRVRAARALIDGQPAPPARLAADRAHSAAPTSTAPARSRP